MDRIDFQKLEDNIKELFIRMGKAETGIALFQKAEKDLKEDIQELKMLLTKKFDEYSKKQDSQTKALYIITGVGITLQVVVVPLIIFIVTRQ